MRTTNFSETLWKWRYKITHLGKNDEKTIADFSSSSDVDTEMPVKSSTAAKMGKTSADASSKKNVEIGANPSIKTLYEGPGSREDAYNWVDYPPKTVTKSLARAHDRVAIKVYKVKDPDKPVLSGRFSLRYYMLEIQNPLLVACLAEVLKKQEMHIEPSEPVTFKDPFVKLYFAYDDLAAKHRELLQNEPNNSLEPFLHLLLRLLDDVFADTRAKLKALRADRLVSFRLAWAYFPRGTTVITWGNNCELLCKVKETRYTRMGNCAVFLIEGEVLQFEGRGFHWEPHTIIIESFKGNLPITELDAYPLEFHEAVEDVRARLTARGRKSLEYLGLTHAFYQGLALHVRGNVTERHIVDGRVLIDVMGYKKHHLAQGSRESSHPVTKKKRLIVYDEEDAENINDEEEEQQQQQPDSTVYDAPENNRWMNNANTQETETQKPPTSAAIKRLNPAAQQRIKERMLELEVKEPHLMYISPLIQGYALKNKLWMQFYIEDIKPMVWNDEAYDHLVYDEQQKDLVLSFVESHRSMESSLQQQAKAMDDVIAGKGQGLVILLSGPPGTGKTLMAEAVADRTRRPLFYLQAEDLGVSPDVLASNLKNVFQMATDWDAVILLDEADVFMAERHPQDIQRNELVSIFLREIEYFRGIIFLTTNLYSTIDSAFRSRVSLHLLFNSLTPEARALIWRKFLDRLPPSKGKKPAVEPEEEAIAGKGHAEDDKLTDEDIRELALWQLNGREIKTAVKMTKTWCDYKGYPMTLTRLENGIRVTSPHASKSSREGGDTSLYEE